jgi:hypothetical protein
MFRDGPTGSLYIGGEWTNPLGGVANTQNLAKLPFGITGPWEPVVETGGFPYGLVNKMFRDGPTGSLYIGGQWNNNLGGVLNTKKIAKLPFGSTGPWKAVSSTFPLGSVYTMFLDGPTGSLYIGGNWPNINGGGLNTKNLAKLPFGNTGPWEAVSSTCPFGSVLTMFRDGQTGSLYIGGGWNNNIGVENTKNLAKLPFGSTQWEPVGPTGPVGPVYTMFRDGPTGSLYIGGQWNNELSGVPNTQNLAKLPFGSTKWEAVGPTGPAVGIVRTMFRDELTGYLYIGGTWTNELGGVPNTQRLARIIEETSIIVNDTKYNLPNIGDTLEFVYDDKWVKLNYS